MTRVSQSVRLMPAHILPGMACLMLVTACTGGGAANSTDAALVAWLRTGAELSCELVLAEEGASANSGRQVLARQQLQAHQSRYPEYQGLMRALDQDVRSLVLAEARDDDVDCAALARGRKVERLIDKALRRPMMEPAGPAST
jgi:hypothetical protein